MLGGARDPSFPAEVLTATAAAVLQGRPHVFGRNGHGVPEHRAGEVQRAVAEFLGAGS